MTAIAPTQPLAEVARRADALGAQRMLAEDIADSLMREGAGPRQVRAALDRLRRLDAEWTAALRDEVAAFEAVLDDMGVFFDCD